jgi:DNA-binding transcriptional MocR family regulator
MKETVYQTIRKRILHIEYQPGQILNEKVLAEEFEVSRSPIKEVLNRLETLFWQRCQINYIYRHFGFGIRFWTGETGMKKSPLSVKTWKNW